MEAVKEGRSREPPESGPPEPPAGAEEALELLKRIEAGDEEAKREWESRDGYRIWKYYGK